MEKEGKLKKNTAKDAKWFLRENHLSALLYLMIEAFSFNSWSPGTNTVCAIILSPVLGGKSIK
jgi:hypothetical protein